LRARALAGLGLPLAAALLAPALARPALGPRYGGTLRIGVQALAPAAPGVPRSADERLLAAMVHATLARPGPEGQPVPELAEGWSSAASGREWSLRLRQPAAFHDGEPVRAADVVRSLRRFLRSPSPAAARMAQALTGGAAFRRRASESLPGVEARETRTVVLRFDVARPLPLAPLTAAAAAVTGGTGAGAGPFAPALIAGQRASFAAAAMHVRGRPYLDRVEMAAAEEPAIAADLRSDRLDLAAGGEGGPLASVLLLAIDPRQPPFDRPPVRAAVAGAVDRANLVRHLVPGGSSDTLLLPPGLLASFPAGSARPGAAVRAQPIMAVSREVPFLVSQRVVAHLAEVGLRVAAEPRSAGRLFTGARAPLSLFLWSPEVPEPALALHELAGLFAAQPQVDELLAAADVELALDRRRALLHKAEAALLRADVIVPLAAVPTSFRAAPRLQGVRVDGGGRILVEDAWWEP
jgi:MarR-like DNA-binding transcriptional regulator SgrR of sgrS sRNA